MSLADTLHLAMSWQVDRELEFPMEELEAKAKVKGAGMFGAWGGFGWGK